MNILLVSALEMETDNKLDSYLPHNLIHTGVGKINATYHLTRRLLVDRAINYEARINIVINYGTAGSRKYVKGSLVDCTKFIQRDMNVTPLGFELGQTPFEEEPHIIECYNNEDFNPIGQNTTCGSGDNFSIDESDWDKWDVVDMEAYSLAKVCRNFEVPFISFKYITDGADDEADSDWETNVKNGVEIFKEEIIGEL